MAKYNVLLIGIKIARDISIQNHEIYDNSLLFVNQACWEFEVHHEDIVPYHAAATQMAEKLKAFILSKFLVAKTCKQTPWLLSPLPWHCNLEYQRKY